MKATGNFEACRNVDPMVVLSGETRAHIDHWLAKFPADRKRSAVLQGLHHSINTPQTGLAAAEAVWVTLRLAELLAWRAPQLLLPAAGGFDVGGGLASADSFSSASSLADSSRTD